MEYSALQKARYAYSPKIPGILKEEVRSIAAKMGKPTESVADRKELKEVFPKTYGLPEIELERGSNPRAGDRRNVGVILSGGQAPGGHNVIAGLFDGLKKGNRQSKLIGFLGGPSGIIEGKSMELTAEYIDRYRNTGGFDIIGSGRTKLESEEQFEKAAAVCRQLDVSAIVIIGGDDSNTNAAVLAEYFCAQQVPISVIGVPKTIDGDLKNEQIESSFGFDTATKTYAELIGNIERDANSAKKYWHFIKLMGRSASHIALECALQTQPNVTIISEEVEQKQTTMAQIVEEIVEVIVKRSEKGENFGVALIPEGLVEFVPEMKSLIAEINSLLAANEAEFALLKGSVDQAAWLLKRLSKSSSPVFASLPGEIQHQLLMDRDPHGNVQVSRIETEKLLTGMIEAALAERKSAGKYKGKFSPLHHFFGYEGRCAFPSNFDSDYCYGLGYTAFLLIASGSTGYMSVLHNLSKPAREWIAGGIPITMMMNLERRSGKVKPVIRKALVELEGKPFKAFEAKRREWALATSYLYPGAIQYYGPEEVCDRPTITLKLERE